MRMDTVGQEFDMFNNKGTKQVYYLESAQFQEQIDTSVYCLKITQGS